MHNFRKYMTAAVVLALAILARGQDVLSIPDFSATQVFESRKATMSMRVFFSGSSVRVERSEALSTLYMPSASKVYNFTTYPDHSRQCVVMKPEEAKMLPSPLALLQGSVLKRSPVGTGVVEGHPCKIENVVVTRADGSTINSKVWEAQDLKGVPIKIESQVGEFTLSAIYRDIVLGSPDNALFTVPNKCTPFEKMGQVAEQNMIR